DSVIGSNPQVFGPMRTELAGPNTVQAETPTVTVQDTHLLVALPIRGDSNANSQASFDVAEGPDGPWTEKCGPELSFAPKLCRIHGLRNGRQYWIRARLSDPEGVTGPAWQVVGPVTYTGLENLALGQAISADTGWGCCPSPEGLVDGRIEN